MCGVSECVSLMQTTRTLFVGISGPGGFIVILMTRWPFDISRHADVGSFVNWCTSTFIDWNLFASNTRFYTSIQLIAM